MMGKVFLVFLSLSILCLETAFCDNVEFEFNYQKNELHCVFNHWKRTHEYVYNALSGKMELVEHKEQCACYTDSGKYKLCWDGQRNEKNFYIVETSTGKEVGSIDHEWHAMTISPNDNCIMLSRDGGGDYIGKWFFSLPDGEYITWRHIMGADFLRQKNAWIFQYELGCEVVDADKWTTVANLEGSPSGDVILTNPLCSYTGRYVACGLNVYETATWKKVAQFTKHAHGGAFTRDDRGVLIPEEDGVHCYSISDGAEIFVLNHGSPYQLSIFVASNGNIFTCNREYGIVKIWDGRSGALLSSFEVKDPFNYIARGDEAYSAGNFSAAIGLYKKASDQGDHKAMYKMGQMYFDGTGVKKNLSFAFSYFDKAFARGNTSCANILGDMYRDGVGTSKNYEKAIECYESVAGGYGDAAKKANYNLGVLYEKGWGVQQNYSRALELYNKASPLQEAVAALDSLFERGLGVTGEDYFTKGNIYYEKKDYVAAKKWFEKGAAMGNDNAQLLLGVLYYNGDGVVVDYAKAKTLWEKAAEKSNSTAIGNLALIYYYGCGVPVDKLKAREYLQKSVQLGSDWAKEKLNKWTF